MTVDIDLGTVSNINVIHNLVKEEASLGEWRHDSLLVLNEVTSSSASAASMASISSSLPSEFADCPAVS